MDTSAENSEKNDRSISPIVSLDGTKARQIREAKKLTQLYVASVVGVTTDTISRWENNRYPTVKRDNAEKLATALDVNLEEILMPDLPPVAEEPAPSRRSRRIPFAFILVLLAILAAAAAAFIFKAAEAPIVAERKLPRFAAPASIVPVQIVVTRKEGTTQGMVIRERLPAGWKLVHAVPAPASGQAPEGEIKWLVPPGSGPVTILYAASAARDATLNSETTVTGKIVVGSDGGTTSATIGGDGTMKISGTHWADRNGDGTIDDNEIMPAYYIVEEMKGFGLDWKTIEAIWSSKGYRWNGGTFQFVPLR